MPRQMVNGASYVALVVKSLPAANAETRDTGLILNRKILKEGITNPTPVSLPENQRKPYIWRHVKVKPICKYSHGQLQDRKLNRRHMHCVKKDFPATTINMVSSDQRWQFSEQMRNTTFFPNSKMDTVYFVPSGQDDIEKNTQSFRYRNNCHYIGYHNMWQNFVSISLRITMC